MDHRIKHEQPPLEPITLHPFQAGHDAALTELIKAVGWNNQQIQGQIAALNELGKSTHGYVLLAKRGTMLLGYVSAQFYTWNRLGQIHGLVVHPESRRERIATRLIEHVEEFLRQHRARGVYVDTPVDNERGRRFYQASGFEEAYTMPEYYDEGQDGVTYIKFFRSVSG